MFTGIKLNVLLQGLVLKYLHLSYCVSSHRDIYTWLQHYQKPNSMLKLQQRVFCCDDILPIVMLPHIQSQWDNHKPNNTWEKQSTDADCCLSMPYWIQCLTKIIEATCPFPVWGQCSSVINMRWLFSGIDALIQKQMIALGLKRNKDSYISLQNIH